MGNMGICLLTSFHVAGKMIYFKNSFYHIFPDVEWGVSLPISEEKQNALRH